MCNKYSMSCDMFEFLLGRWDMQFGLSFGFWVGFGFCFGIAFESDFGGGGKLCVVCGMVGFCVFAWDMCLRLGLGMGFGSGVGVESRRRWWRTRVQRLVVYLGFILVLGLCAWVWVWG